MSLVTSMSRKSDLVHHQKLKARQRAIQAYRNLL